MNMRNNETMMTGIIAFTLHDKIPVYHMFHCGVVPFDNKKSAFTSSLLNSVPEISDFSTETPSFLSGNLILTDLKRKRFEESQ